jgi:hypothetical protein
MEFLLQKKEYDLLPTILVPDINLLGYQDQVYEKPFYCDTLQVGKIDNNA